MPTTSLIEDCFEVESSLTLFLFSYDKNIDKNPKSLRNHVCAHENSPYLWKISSRESVAVQGFPLVISVVADAKIPLGSFDYFECTSSKR